MRRALAHSPLKYLVSPAAGCVSCVSIRPQSAVSIVFSSANTSTSSSSAASLLPPGVPRYAVRTARPRLAHVQHTYSNTPPGQSVLRRRWLRCAGGRYVYPAATLEHHESRSDLPRRQPTPVNARVLKHLLKVAVRRTGGLTGVLAALAAPLEHLGHARAARVEEVVQDLSGVLEVVAVGLAVAGTHVHHRAPCTRGERRQPRWQREGTGERGGDEHYLRRLMRYQETWTKIARCLSSYC
eukprot:scaffold28428_cov62-Phaeocystis_antarctica.AAC.3